LGLGIAFSGGAAITNIQTMLLPQGLIRYDRGL
jgi:hypothetical protein